MLDWIDGLWQLDFIATLGIGIYLGRRWERVKQEAICRARLCPQILKARAESASLNKMFDFMRGQLRDKDEKIHALKTSQGMLQKTVADLTYQLPRPVRRMWA